MFCRMGSLHVCRPQVEYGRGQDSPLRSYISCEWLKACVLPLFWPAKVFSWMLCCGGLCVILQLFKQCCLQDEDDNRLLFRTLGSPERETPLRSQIFTEASVLQPEGRFQTNAVSLMTSIFTVTADSLRLNLEMISRMRAVLSEKWVCALNTMGVCSLCCL